MSIFFFESVNQKAKIMRLRIETLPPLPPLKTWLVVTPGIFGLGTRTVNDLCKRLISEFGLPAGIQLQYGGFDLHKKDPIEGLLDKDDLVQYILFYSKLI
jgi:hypothetical protein